MPTLSFCSWLIYFFFKISDHSDVRQHRSGVQAGRQEGVLCLKLLKHFQNLTIQDYMTRQFELNKQFCRYCYHIFSLYILAVAHKVEKQLSPQ
jgi:hypothetical protein